MGHYVSGGVLNVLPIFPCHGAPCGAVGHPVFREERKQRFPIGHPLSQLKHLRRSQLRLRVALATSATWPRSAFGKHVPDVIGWRTEEQVVGAHTGRVVATVADVLPLRDRSILHTPYEPMRVDRCPSLAKTAVPVRVTRSSPGPARHGVVNDSDLAPESLVRRPLKMRPALAGAITSIDARLGDVVLSSATRAATGNGNTLRGHHDLQNRGVTPPAVDAARGLRVAGIIADTGAP